MAYTRGQVTSSLAAAAQALLSLRTNLSFTRYTAQPSQSTATAAEATVPSKGYFWAQWTNWYHAFLSEVADEFPQQAIAERRAEATSRWVSYTAKKARCSESQVRAWLRTADQKALVAAYA